MPRLGSDSDLRRVLYGILNVLFGSSGSGMTTMEIIRAANKGSVSLVSFDEGMSPSAGTYWYRSSRMAMGCASRRRDSHNDENRDGLPGHRELHG